MILEESLDAFGNLINPKASFEATERYLDMMMEIIKLQKPILMMMEVYRILSVRIG